MAANGNVSSLNQAQCLAAVAQLARSPNFVKENPHLAPAEVSNLRLPEPDWPQNKPVFSPYKPTKSGYSQIRYGGTKYLLHRVAFKSYYGDFDDRLDISHTLFVGPRSS